MTPLPVITSSGPATAKIMFVGEAPGQEEQMFGKPFIGPSGRELRRIAAQAGIELDACYLTNVFHCRPLNNDLLNFCGPKDTALAGMPPIKPGKYIRKEFQFELIRLQEEISSVNPNIIVALGATALGALTGIMGIGKFRGTWINANGRKVLATYHPAAVLRDWSLRVIVVSDLKKVAAQADTREIVIPQRRILIDPTMHELEFAYEQHLRDAAELSVDIETQRGQITVIGFAPTPDLCVVVPFIDSRQKDYHYWRTEAEELRAFKIVHALLTGPAKKVLQNGSYDLQYIWKTFSTPLRHFADDTSLMHHALYPELQKDLGFLGSIYTAEPMWKDMRRTATNKKEE